MRTLKSNKKGFTLIEMIVVIVIIAILAAIAVPAVMKYIDDAKETKQIASAHNAMVSIQADLTKAEATSSTGLFTGTNPASVTTGDASSDTDLGKAINAAAADHSGLTKVQLCSNALSEGDAIANCSALTKNHVNEIKTFVITISDKNVAIPTGNDSAAFVIQAAE